MADSERSPPCPSVYPVVKCFFACAAKVLNRPSSLNLLYNAASLGGVLNRWLEKFFELSSHQTTPRREIVAGLTTFFTMSYIVAVNPPSCPRPACRRPLADGNHPHCYFGTLLMGLYANRPFAIAPYMGENAFIAFTGCTCSATHGRARWALC